MCHQMQIEGLYLVNATQNLLFQFFDIELEASLLWRSTIPISTDKPLLISPPSIHPVLDEPTPPLTPL